LVSPGRSAGPFGRRNGQQRSFPPRSCPEPGPAQRLAGLPGPLGGCACSRCACLIPATADPISGFLPDLIVTSACVRPPSAAIVRRKTRPASN
jgi:hypothetical protein